MAKILVVDDEKILVKGLRFNLEGEGYEVTTGENGEEAVRLAKSDNFDLILLDVMMPVMDGLQACMKIREFSTVPIIMLTAKGEDMDKIMGFEYGADDYVTKPFNILELKMRIKAMLRRAGNAGTKAVEEEKLNAHGLELVHDTRTVYRDGKQIELTLKEFDLTEFLMKNKGRVYSREQLLNLVWGYDYLGDDRTVDVHIRRIREKLEPEPANPIYIMTKWGVGYYFNGD